MSDYIKREDARRAVLGYERFTGIDELPYEYAECEIDRIPAADVVEVVRCKDCIHRDSEPLSDNEVWCYWHESREPDNGYCMYGARRKR